MIEYRPNFQLWSLHDQLKEFSLLKFKPLGFDRSLQAYLILEHIRETWAEDGIHYDLDLDQFDDRQLFKKLVESARARKRRSKARTDFAQAKFEAREAARRNPHVITTTVETRVITTHNYNTRLSANQSPRNMDELIDVDSIEETSTDRTMPSLALAATPELELAPVAASCPMVGRASPLDVDDSFDRIMMRNRVRNDYNDENDFLPEEGPYTRIVPMETNYEEELLDFDEVLFDPLEPLPYMAMGQKGSHSNPLSPTQSAQELTMALMIPSSENVMPPIVPKMPKIQRTFLHSPSSTLSHRSLLLTPPFLRTPHVKVKDVHPLRRSCRHPPLL